MKTSSEIASAAKIIGEEKTIEYMAKAGFDAWDFSMFDMCGYDWNNKKFLKSNHVLAGDNYLKFARKLKHVGIENGIVCNQSHAPFPSYCNEIRSYYKRAIECTAEAGGKICVIHPDNFKGPEENAELFLEILPFAKDCNVMIATENMWTWDNEKDHCVFAACATPESFCDHFNKVSDDFFVACLDIGHAEMKGSGTTAIEMIKALGPKLKALHIHDNDKWHDSHQIPFSMKINFEEIVSALAEIDYCGYFTLEADKYLNKYSKENVFEGIKALADSAKKLSKIYEKKLKKIL